MLKSLRKRWYEFFKKELHHELSTVATLALTFIGATLVGRTVWQWIGHFYGGILAFGLGFVILFIVAYMRHHKFM